MQSVTLTLSGANSATTQRPIILPMGKKTYISSIDRTVKPIGFLPDFAMGPNGIPGSKSDRFDNPAVQLAIYQKDKLLGNKWLFAKFPDYTKVHKGLGSDYALRLKKWRVGYASGIRVVKDPGMTIVYPGFILLIIGTFLSCYVFYRRLWGELVVNGSVAELHLAGETIKNRLEFQREFARLDHEMSKAFAETGFTPVRAQESLSEEGCA